MSEQTPTRFAKAPHLWALGVGAVISGDFFGWQAGLVAGFIGLVINLLIVSVLYVLLSFSIAELSTSIPCGGGPYVFAHRSMGPTAAFFAGLAESLKVIVTCAVVVVGIGSYLNQILTLDEWVSPLWWILFYVLFTVLNIAGIELSFRVQLVCTLLSVLILVVFYIGAATQVDYQKWVVDLNWEYNDGINGVMSGFSFALWFYLGIEELPLAVEETIDPAKNMPIGLISSIGTLLVLSFCTLFFNTAISPGAAEMYVSVSPLLDGYKSVFGDNNVTSGFSWILIVGLITSFHSFIFCMGRLLYAIARDGFLPKIMTRMHSTRHTPYVALIVGTSIGCIIAIILHYAIGDLHLGSVLINLALVGALISYAFQLVSFIILRWKEPELHRPYKSVFGVPGALLCLFLCAFVLGTIFYQGVQDNYFLASIIFAAVYFAVGGLMYHFVIKKHIQNTAGPVYEDSHLSLDKSLLSPSSKEAV